MQLFKYEMKKLLFNRMQIMLILALAAVYGFLGFVLSIEDSGLNAADRARVRSEYLQLVTENKGLLNTEQLIEAKATVEAAMNEYGRGDDYNRKVMQIPELHFAMDYVRFGGKVELYLNGPGSQDESNIMGLYPIQDRLSELEAQNRTEAYEYRYYQNRLEAVQKMGEPVFEHIGIGNVFFIMFDGILIVLFFMMVPPFFISPLFTQEVRTEMDSIILCSVKGRREIVTAKLLTVVLTSAVLAAVYLGAGFIGMCIGNGDFYGFGAALRGVERFEHTTLDITVAGAAILATAWLVLITSVFGLVLSFISCKLKNQSSAFGVGIVILLSGMISGSIPANLYEIFWPVVDFNFAALSMFVNIFGDAKAYNFFGTPISHQTAALIACILIGAAAVFMTYRAQKKRSTL